MLYIGCVAASPTRKTPGTELYYIVGWALGVQYRHGRCPGAQRACLSHHESCSQMSLETLRYRCATFQPIRVVWTCPLYADLGTRLKCLYLGCLTLKAASTIVIGLLLLRAMYRRFVT